MKPTSPGGFQWKQTSSRQPVSAPQTSKRWKSRCHRSARPTTRWGGEPAAGWIQLGWFEDFEIFGSGYIRMIQDVCRKPWIRHWIKHCHSEEKHIYFFWSGCILVFFLCCTCFGERERETQSPAAVVLLMWGQRRLCNSQVITRAEKERWGPERWGFENRIPMEYPKSKGSSILL